MHDDVPFLGHISVAEMPQRSRIRRCNAALSVPGNLLFSNGIYNFPIDRMLQRTPKLRARQLL
jgi:hypothetical protein